MKNSRKKSIGPQPKGSIRPKASSLNAEQNETWLPIVDDQDSAQLQSFQDWARELDREEESTPQPYIYEQPSLAGSFKFKLGLIFYRPWNLLQRTLIKERDAGAAFLWAPVLFGIGCIIYFTLPREPLIWAFPVLTCLSLFVAWRSGRGHWTFGLSMALALVAAGVSAGQLRTGLVDTKMLSRTTVGVVTGQIVLADYRANGSVRYTLDVSGGDVSGANGLEIRGLKDPPKRVRLSVRKGGEQFQVGQFIKGRARLGPPPGPSFPGAFDFSFLTWFKGIGGSGFFLDRPVAVDRPAHSNNSLALGIARVRASVGRIIRDALPGPSGGVATALIVGDRSGIDKETAQALRRSGLAHILAISGLHMALVAVTLIYFMRGIFACFPGVSLHYPVKKWASAVALLAAATYLMLSGANVSTQRAFIMVSIMLVAVMLDRRALTMRNVALAAFVVLLLAPEAVLTPGFQMSFAAVAALVATFEVLSKRRRDKKQNYINGFLGVVQRFVIRDMGGLALTSLVAGFSTGLFAAYHFYRVAPFGLLANLMAMPIVSMAVMPLALASVLAMPFGLEAVPLELMAVATGKVVDIASWVSTLEPRGGTGFIPLSALVIGAIALLFSTLFRTRLKLLALPMVAVFTILVMGRNIPDVLILENGKQIGVMAEEGGLQFLRPNAEKFSTKMWRGAFDPSRLEAVSTVKRGKADKEYSCDKVGCSIVSKGYRIVHLTSTAGLAEDCRLADVLIIPFFTPNACTFLPENQRPIVIERDRLSRYGAHSLTINIPKNMNPQDKMITGAEVTGTAIDKTAINVPVITIKRSYGQHPRPWTAHKFK